MKKNILNQLLLVVHLQLLNNLFACFCEFKFGWQKLAAKFKILIFKNITVINSSLAMLPILKKKSEIPDFR